MVSGPAPLVDERKFIPNNPDEAKALYDVLLASGAAPSSARGLIGWLLTHTGRADDPASAVTRSRYRQLLHSLGEPPWKGGETSEAMGAYNDSTADMPIDLVAFVERLGLEARAPAA